MGFISSEFSIIKPHTNLPINCRDKDDNNILQLAESVFADYIITGDKDLLILKHFKKTRILLPSEFLSLFKD
jgi:putative PIN family toxin of toxin-antitoxin system